MTRPLRATLALVTAAVLAAACAPGSTDTATQSAETEAAQAEAPATEASATEASATEASASEGAAPCEATDYPTKEITLTVVYPAGSAPDSTARTLAGVLERELGQSIVVVNREGGNGVVGITEVAAAEPDGYTIGFTASPPLVVTWQLTETGYEGPDVVQPIAQTNEVPSVLFVNGDSDIESIEDFVAAAGERRLNVGIPGEASIQRFQLEGFFEEAGITVEPVITDAGQQVLPTVNGTYDAAIAQPAPILQYVERGDLRMIGYFGDQAPEGLDVPTFAEAGYDIPYGGFEGFVAPPGVPEPVACRLEEAVEAAVDSEEFQQYVRETSGVAAYAGADATAARLQEEVALYAEVIDRLGLRQ